MKNKISIKRRNLLASDISTMVLYSNQNYMIKYLDLMM